MFRLLSVTVFYDSIFSLQPKLVFVANHTLTKVLKTDYYAGTTPDLARSHMVLCHSKFRSRGCRFPLLRVAPVAMERAPSIAFVLKACHKKECLVYLINYFPYFIQAMRF